MITLSQVLYKNQVHFRDFLYKVCQVILLEKYQIKFLEQQLISGILHNLSNCYIFSTKQLFS